jgi:5-methylcytosine-specific restriction enzyme A
MSRSTPEWIGKTDDSRPPPRVVLRIFEAHGGICHRTKRKITAADEWDVDHVVALINGGENREANMAPILREAHREKTAEDVAIKAKVNRVRKKHLGIERKFKRSLPGSRSSAYKAKVGGGWEKR